MENVLQDGFGMLPNKVLFDNRLSSTEKLLYAYISSLSARDGKCWASNKYIGEKLGVSAWTVSTGISNLEACGYLKTKVKLHYRREIFLKGVCEKSHRGIGKITKGVCEKPKENNIREINKLNKQTNNTSLDGYKSFVKKLSEIKSL